MTAWRGDGAGGMSGRGVSGGWVGMCARPPRDEKWTAGQAAGVREIAPSQLRAGTPVWQELEPRPIPTPSLLQGKRPLSAPRQGTATQHLQPPCPLQHRTQDAPPPGLPSSAGRSILLKSDTLPTSDFGQFRAGNARITSGPGEQHSPSIRQDRTGSVTAGGRRSCHVSQRTFGHVCHFKHPSRGKQ